MDPGGIESCRQWYMLPIRLRPGTQLTHQKLQTEMAKLRHYLPFSHPRRTCHYYFSPTIIVMVVKSFISAPSRFHAYRSPAIAIVLTCEQGRAQSMPR